MEIEKISKYMITTTISHSKANSDGGESRRVLVSVPRVRWLERDIVVEPPKKRLARDFLPPPRTLAIKRVKDIHAKPILPRTRGADGLTPREREVESLIKQGKTAKEIVQELSITADNFRKIRRRIANIRLRQKSDSSPQATQDSAK